MSLHDDLKTSVALEGLTAAAAECPDGYGNGFVMTALNRSAIRNVLAGDATRLVYAFLWDREAHGGNYWADRKCGRVPLSDTDKQFLRYLLREYRGAA